jgi:hypothetical protein
MTTLSAGFSRARATTASLLGALLRAKTPLGRHFRTGFARALAELEPPLRLAIDENPVDTRSEVMLVQPHEPSQAIDLVIDVGEDRVGIEVKVLGASARAGQLQAQYALLRASKRSVGKRVHCLFLYPGPTSAHEEVECREGDVATSMDWKTIFAVLDAARRHGDVATDDPLRILSERAVVCYDKLQTSHAGLAFSAERGAVFGCMVDVRDALAERLARHAAFADCSWAAKPFRYAPADYMEGPLRHEDERLRGRSLFVESHPTGEGNEFSIAVGVGVNKTHSPVSERAALVAALAKCPSVNWLSKSSERRNELRAFHMFRAIVKDGVARGPDERPLVDVLAEGLERYAVAFGDLLRLQLN